MSLNRLYRSLSAEPEQPEVLVEITTAGEDPLDDPDIVTVPFDAFGASLPGKRGFKDLPFGTLDTDTLQVVVDLTVLVGSDELEDLRDALLHPTAALEGVIGPVAGYSRTYDLHNLWRFYGPEVSPGVRLIIWEGVQRPLPETPAELGTHTVLTIDLVGIGLYLGQTIRMGDVAAIAQDMTGEPLGPFRYVYEELYSGSGNTYAYARGHVGTGDYPEHTFQPLWVLWEAIRTVAESMYSAIARRESFVVVQSETVGDSTPADLDHWTLFKHNHLADGLANVTDTLPPEERYILATTKLHSLSAGLATGGLFCFGSPVKDDTLERWKTLADFLTDRTEAAFCKGLWLRDGGSDALLLSLHWVRSGPYTPVIGIADMPHPVPAVVGAMRVTAAKGAISGANGSDQASVSFVPDFGTEEEEQFALPHGWHTSATLWDVGTESYRRYEDLLPVGFDVIAADPDDQMFVIAPTPNVWAIYYPTMGFNGDDNLLTSTRMIRAHRATWLYDGVDTLIAPGVGDLPEYPTPDPHYEGNISGYTKYALESFGNPLRLALLQAQVNSSMPAAACHAIVVTFGSEQQTTYESDLVPAPEGGPEMVGSVSDSTAFPSGNIFIGSETWLGSLPGAPHILASEFDLFSRYAKLKLLGVP